MSRPDPTLVCAPNGDTVASVNTSPHKPSILVVQHAEGGGPHRIGDWLRQCGAELDIVHGYTGADVIPDTLTHDAMIVMGGGYLPDADDRADWLAPTRRLVQQALDNDVPYMGVCLGGQILAHVAGGVVEGDVGAPEAGSTPIRLRSDVDADALFHGLPQELTAMEHHVDAITKLPANAIWLAHSDRCPNQAFRVGARAWGFQFHPEMTPDRILGWGAEKLASQGFDRDDLHAQAVRDEPASTPVWRTVVERFATLVSEAASRRA